MLLSKKRVSIFSWLANHGNLQLWKECEFNLKDVKLVSLEENLEWVSSSEKMM